MAFISLSDVDNMGVARGKYRRARLFMFSALPFYTGAATINFCWIKTIPDCGFGNADAIT